MNINYKLLLDYEFKYLYNLQFHSDIEMKQIHNITFNDFQDSKVLKEHQMLYIKSFLTFLMRDNPSLHQKRTIKLAPDIKKIDRYYNDIKHNCTSSEDNPFKINFTYTQWLKSIAEKYCIYQRYLLADKEIQEQVKLRMPRLLENRYIVMADTNIREHYLMLSLYNGEPKIADIKIDSARITDIKNIYNVAIEIDLHDYDLSIPENLIKLEEEKQRIKEIIRKYDLQPTIAYTTNRSIYMQYSFSTSLTIQQAVNIKKFLIFKLYNELQLLADRSNMNPAILHHLKITLHKSYFQSNVVAPFQWQDHPYEVDSLYIYAQMYISAYKKEYDHFWMNKCYDAYGKSTDKAEAAKIIDTADNLEGTSICEKDTGRMLYANEFELKEYVVNFDSDRMFDDKIVINKSIGTYKTLDNPIEYMYHHNFSDEEIKEYIRSFGKLDDEEIEFEFNCIMRSLKAKEKQENNTTITENINMEINKDINENIFDIKINNTLHNQKMLNYNENFEKMKEWKLTSTVIESSNIQSILDKDINEIREVLQLDMYDLQPKTYTYSQAFKYILQALGNKLHLFFNIDVLSHHRKAMLHQIYHEHRPSMSFNIINSKFADCEIEYWYSHNKKPSGSIIDLFMWCLISTCNDDLNYKEALYNTIRFLSRVLNITIKSQLNKTFDNSGYTKKVMKLYNEYKNLYIQNRNKKSIAQKEMDDLKVLIQLLLNKIYENFNYSNNNNHYQIQHMITTNYLKEKLGWDKSKSYRMINQLLHAQIFNRISDKDQITDNKLLSHLNAKHNIPYIFTLINFNEKIVIADNIKITRFEYARNCINCIFEYEKMIKTTINRWNKQHINNFNEFIPQIINVIVDEKKDNEQTVYTFLEKLDNSNMTIKLNHIHRHLYNLNWKTLNKFISLKNKLLNDDIYDYIQKMNLTEFTNNCWYNVNFVKFYTKQYNRRN